MFLSPHTLTVCTGLLTGNVLSTVSKATSALFALSASPRYVRRLTESSSAKNTDRLAPAYTVKSLFHCPSTGFLIVYWLLRILYNPCVSLSLNFTIFCTKIYFLPFYFHEIQISHCWQTTYLQYVRLLPGHIFLQFFTTRNCILTYYM